jgi:3-hydroxyacyl-CoA dehydrogenase
MSDLQCDLVTKQRFLVAHPFNPPHIIPVVEVIGGNTSAEALVWCCKFLEHLGKTVLRLKKEVIGHVVNRLQAALFQEALCLVRDGVADVADIDRGIALGPAVRWALMGPFLTFHLGALEGGIRSYLRNLGPAHARMWRDLGKIEALEPELVEAVVKGVEEETGAASVSQLALRRDTEVMDLIAHLGRKQRRLIR